MKYHNNLKTVLISLAVLLLFSVSAGLIILELNLTSPTLMVADSFFAEFTEAETPFSFQIKAVERNLRDRVRIKDVEVFYEEANVASFDYIEIQMSLIDLFKYGITGKNYAKVYLHEGVVTIPESMFSAVENETGETTSDTLTESFSLSDISFPDFLKKYRFSINIEDFDLHVGRYASFDHVAAEFSLGGSLKNSEAALYIPEFHASYAGFNADLNYIGLTFRYADVFELKAMIDDLQGKNGDVRFVADKTTFALLMDEKQSLSKETVTGRLSAANISVESEKYGSTIVSNLEGFVSANKNYLTVETINYGYADYKAQLNQLAVNSTNFVQFQAVLRHFSGEVGVIGLDLDYITASTDLEKKDFSVGLSKAKTSSFEEFTQGWFGGVLVENVEFKGSYAEDLNLATTFSSVVENNREGFTDLSFLTKASILIKDHEISHFGVQFDNVNLGFSKILSSISLTGNSNDCAYSLNYGSFADVNGTLRFDDKQLNGSISLADLKVSNFNPFLRDNEELIKNITEANSGITGNVEFKLALDDQASFGFVGQTDLDLKLNGLHYNTLKSDLEIKASLEKEIENIRLYGIDVITDYVTAGCNGEFDLKQMLPDINFQLSLSNGTSLLNGSLELKGTKIYEYNAVIPRFENSFMRGTVDFTEDGLITASNLLKTGNTNREYEFELNLDQKKLSITSPKLLFSGDYNDGIKLSASFDHLDTVEDGYSNPIYIDGSIAFDFDSKAKDFTVVSDGLTLSDLWFIPSKPTASFRITGDEKLIAVHDLQVFGDSPVTYSGQGKYDFESKAFTFVLNENESTGQLVLSVYKDDVYAGILKAQNMDLALVGVSGMVGSANLAGRAAELKDFTFTGTINAEPIDANNDSRKLTGRISIDATSLDVQNVRFTNTGVDLSIPSIVYDSLTGNFALDDLELFLKGEHEDRDYPIQVELFAEGNLTEQDSIYSAVFNLMRSRGEGISLGMKLKSLSIDNSQILVTDKYTNGSINNGVLELDGNFASGSLDLNVFKGSLELDVLPLAKLGVELDFEDSLEASARLDGFNMYLMNLFFNTPLLVFKNDYVMGDIGIKQTDDGFNLNGNLYSDEVSLEIFWAPDQLITLHNPKFTIWNNDIRTSLTSTTVLNYDDYSRIGIDMIVGFGFSPSLSFEGYDAEIFVPEGEKLKVRIPLPDTNIDILGYVNGHYKFTGYDGRVTNDGHLNLLDTEISYGMNPYPEWYGLTGDMFIDLDFNFTRNNLIKYPAGPNPIVSIVIADNTDLFFHMGHDGIKVTGDLQIRGGEIFYFQKYFYVVDGNIRFEDPEKLDPKISLRAALRDYDKNGNKVEIYLVMKDNTFDNISPTFESSPQMEISEIMEILGQSILSTSTYGTVSVSSMASLVTESVDVLSKLGIIERSNMSAELNSSIKKVFHLDTFSLHTNIVNNIVTDTISNAAFESIETYSPIARYLNGTTLNVGKYLTPDLYLQARLNLDAKKDRHAYTLFADDLVLDTEISLEWTNPAFEVTFFSTPKYLSFYSFMETFGFTIKKTFKF